MRPAASILITLAICGLTVVLEFPRSRQIAALETQQADLLRRASRVGRSPGDASTSLPQGSGRQTGDDHLLPARDFLAAWRRLAARPEGDLHARQEKAELLLTLQGMDSAQLLLIWSAIDPFDDELNEKGIPDGLAARVLEQLTHRAPEKVLALDLGSAVTHMREFINSALQNVASTNPALAQQWLEQKKGLSEMDRYGKQLSIIRGALKTDPRFAFEIVANLSPAGQKYCTRDLFSHRQWNDSLETLLPLSREWLAGRPDSTSAADMVFTPMAMEFVGMPYQQATEKLASVGLTDSEKIHFANGLTSRPDLPGSAKWIDWIQNNLPPDNATSTIHRFIENWMMWDQEAAGEWLQSAPDGPAKQAATQAYASSIAVSDPQSAIEWASSLADPNSRDLTYKQIHNNWPTNDPEGKANFAKEHGIHQ